MDTTAFLFALKHTVFVSSFFCYDYLLLSVSKWYVSHTVHLYLFTDTHLIYK